MDGDQKELTRSGGGLITTEVRKEKECPWPEFAAQAPSLHDVFFVVGEKGERNRDCK